MIRLGDTTRRKYWRGHIAPPAKAKEERPSSRGRRQRKEGSWQMKEDLVGYFGKQDQERRFKHTALVLGHWKGAEV